ncbi:hypothetical protein DB30_05577 [Enhygromyxa salina]|uniref:Uncharacterized protein n=1 Tax=Enhygromyxa salina TaxID=215803 RepID=A0A0C2D0T7_9BACT|nr:hypothetical protein DB30_05577 [Enhygromyxa salina]
MGSVEWLTRSPARGAWKSFMPSRRQSKTQLADEDEVPPNGQTGAQILAGVPESFHTSLH